MNKTRKRLQSQLKRWTVHCSVNAAPSFLIATIYLDFMAHPPAVAAMLLGVGLMIIAYACLTTFHRELSDPGSLMARSLAAGARIRLVMSLISLPLLTPTPAAFLVPDLWAGVAAAGAVNLVASHLGGGSELISLHGAAPPPFAAVFATTAIEGLLLSLLLIMISFFAMLVIQRRDIRRAILRDFGKAC